MVHPAPKRLSSAVDGEDDSQETMSSKRRKLQDGSQQSQSGAVEEELGTQPMEEEDVEQYDTWMKKRKRLQAASTSSVAGTISSVVLVNFMCHEHLEVDLGPKLNFIVGHNGSGKSAVLTGIAVALGASGKVTGRGQSVSELIMTDKDQAKIILTMVNAGAEAYKPELYPSNIVIERTISRSGSSYKFRATKDGKVLAKTHDELLHICQHFHIRIDSPLTLLTQDAAKTFLSKAEPRQLYKFFIEGTNLGPLQRTHELSATKHQQLHVQLDKLEAQVPALMDTLNRAKKEVQKGRLAANIREEISKCSEKLAWAFVARKEADLEVHDGLLEEQNKRLQKIEHKLQELSDKADPITALVQQAEQQFAVDRRNRAKLTEEERVLKAKYDEARAQESEESSTVRSLEKEVERREEDVAKLVKQIASKGNDGSTQISDEEAQYRTKLSEYETIIANVKQALPKHKRDAEQGKISVDRINEEVEGLRQKGRDLQNSINDIDLRRRVTRDAGTNRMNAFGANTQVLRNLIGQHRWHHSEPIGPLGLYVELEDEKYKGLAHSALGRLMCGFAVQDPRDQAQLWKVIKEAQQRGYSASPSRTGGIPQIVLFKRDETFDYSSGDLSRLGPTVLSKLKITHSDVLSILITQAQIEKTLVADNNVAALDLINKVLASDRVSQVTVLTADGFRTFGANYNKTQTRNSVPLPDWHGNNLFVKDLQAELRHLETEENTLLQQKSDCARELDAKAKEKRTAEAARKKAKDELDRCENKLPELMRGKTATEDALRQLQPEDGDVLLSVKADTELELAGYKRDLETARQQQTIKQAASAAARDAVDAMSKAWTHLEIAETQTKANFQNAAKDDELLKRDLKHYGGMKVEQERELVEAGQKHERMAQEIQDWAAKATAMHRPSADDPSPFVRPVVKESLEELQEQEKTLKANMSKAQNISAEALQELVERARAAKATVVERLETIGGFRSLSLALSKAIDTREDKWRALRKHIALRAKMAFVTFINKRAMEGRLEFDYETEELTMKILPAGSTLNISDAKGVAQLSGGERSFSTISLMLSFWDTVPSAIRCLDEWDVFLDSVNRSVAYTALIEGTRVCEGKQYIFISPLGGDKKGPDIKTIRMADPTRNQATLQFSNA